MRVLAAMASMCLLTGCGGWFSGKPTGGGSADIRVSGVPFYPQKGFRCGPSAMAAMLQWSGLDLTPASLDGRFMGEMADPKATLVDAARQAGRLAYPVSGMEALEAELAAGHPVLVLENLGVAADPLWNCTVAIGYEGNGARFLVNGGDEPAKQMSKGLLERLWAETNYWGMVVLRPGEMPATARQTDMVAAARGLETAGRHWEAVLAYDAVLSRWPNDAAAQMGLGSSLQLLGDLHGAADAYRAAAAESRDPAPALEALSHVAAEIGDQPALPKKASINSAN